MAWIAVTTGAQAAPSSAASAGPAMPVARKMAATAAERRWVKVSSLNSTVSCLKRTGGDCSPPVPVMHGSDRDLVADRQRPDALARRREDRVAQGRREGRDAGLADACRRHFNAVRHDVRAGLGRRFVDPDHLIVVEVGLLDAAVLEGDLAVAG